MGLDIWIDGKVYYDHSYGCLHELRLWVCQKFGITMTDDKDHWVLPVSKFPHLLNHADNEGDYVLKSHKPTLQRGNVFELRKELEEIGKFKSEMPEHTRLVFTDLLHTTEMSIKLKKKMEFG